MKYVIILNLVLIFSNGILGQAINASTYPFSKQTGIDPEDMSSGTTIIIGAGIDDGSSELQNIGFDFWFGGTRYTKYSASPNGFIRMGVLINFPGTGAEFSNGISSFSQVPIIAPYWDDIRTSANGGKVHAKTIGISPNRKLILEWCNMDIPKLTSTLPSSFQLWLSESTGKIEFIYGKPGIDIPSNSGAGGASIGFNRTGSGPFASVNASTSSISYSIATNNNTAPIASGTKFTFTPPIPISPTGLTFSPIGGFSMTLNWQDNASDEFGYLIYRSDDGGNAYHFIAQTNANATSYSQTSLQPTTTYFWKVFAVSYGGGISGELEGSQATLGFNNISSNGTGGGNWSNPATWENGIIPIDVTDVLIKDGDVVTIDMNANAYNIQVGQSNSGMLQYESAVARTLNVFNSLEIKQGATIQTGITGTVTNHILNVYENLLNNGTLDLAGTTTGTPLNFIGSANSSFSGDGIMSDIFGITINKSSLVNMVEMNLSNFSVRGVSDNSTSGFLSLSTGTFKISGTNTFSGTLFTLVGYGPYDQPSSFTSSTSSFWLNNPNFTALGQHLNINVNGEFRISQGVFNAGALFNNSIIISSSANFIVEGGTLNIAGRCSTAVFIQTGGITNICTVGSNFPSPSFEMKSGNFTFTGGIMRLVKLNSIASANERKDYECFATTTNFTNGKLILGYPGYTSAVNGEYNFRIRGITPAMELTATNIIGQSGAIMVGNLESRGNVLVNENTRMLINNGFNWTINSSTLSNNGTITYAGVNTSLIFNGDENACTYKGTGVMETNGTGINLVVNNTSGLVIDPAINNNLIVNKLQLVRGSITNSHKITLGTGLSSNSTISFGASGALVAPGNFDVAPLFNIGTGGLRLEYLGPALNREIGHEMPPERSLHTLTINNGGSILTMAGGNVQVKSNLNLISGKIDMKGDTLTLGADVNNRGQLGNANSESYIFNGKYRRWITIDTLAPGHFPIGIAAHGRPANIMFTTSPSTGGTITTEFIEGSTSNAGLPLNEGNLPVNSISPAGYWKFIAGDGLSGGIYTISLTPNGIQDISNFTELVLVKRLNTASAWELNGSHLITAGSNKSPVLSRKGMSGFGEFGVGLPQFPAPPGTTWTGAISAEWEDAGNWSNGVPGAYTEVTIPSGMARYPIVFVNTTIKKLNVSNSTTISIADGVLFIISGD